MTHRARRLYCQCENNSDLVIQVLSHKRVRYYERVCINICVLIISHQSERYATCRNKDDTEAGPSQLFLPESVNARSGERTDKEISAADNGTFCAENELPTAAARGH
ncbi:hypothetical protein EVAR_97012_1 [Eumeta japonica]|uniref:Uncharacterized protein n=1 Tax=Eumeta variegata TaxID=151549 RepID=A0A4C1WNN5_EUMVA|nr:hypothetical protein EVAR_97012_1 [Eumeta japonica]